MHINGLNSTYYNTIRKILNKTNRRIIMLRSIINLFVLIIFTLSSAFAREDEYHQLTLKGMELAYDMQIEKATEIFDEIIKLDPKNPHGYLLQSVNYYYRFQLEERHEEFEKKFKKYISDAIKISKKNLFNKQKRLDALFYLGTAHMYFAAYHGGQNNWLRAYMYGKQGIEYLEKVVEINPNYYDAYLGLGLYHYYADVMPNFVKTVSSFLGIKGDRSKGLYELQLAAEKGTYSKAEAMFFLGNIYLYMEKDYSKSLHYSKKLANLYPDNPGFLIFLGENEQKNGNHTSAIEHFKTVIKEKNYYPYRFFEYVSYYHLGNLYFDLNDFGKAIAHYVQAIEVASQSSGNEKWVFAWASFKTGECYDMLGRHREAINTYKSVKKSDHKPAYKLAQERIKRPLLKIDMDLIRGQNFAKTKNYDKAIKIYEDALSKATENTDDYSSQKLPEIQYHIAKALYKKEAFEEAILNFNEILTMKNIKEKWIKPWTHFYLGNCYKEIGDVQKAKAEYEIAYKHDDKELRFKIDKLNERLQSNWYRTETAKR